MLLPLLLVTAWLLPLASFTLVVFFGPRMGKHGRGAAYLATGAIGLGFLLSFAALVIWLGAHPIAGRSHTEQDAERGRHGDAGIGENAIAGRSDTEQDAETGRRGDAGIGENAITGRSYADQDAERGRRGDAGIGAHPIAGRSHAEQAGQEGQVGEHPSVAVAALSGTLYSLGSFGALEVNLSYYIDALTIAMFCMVTLVATCIHVYSFGYMHEELHDVTDPLVTLADGLPLVRRGRFHRFYQYLSLFCFSMLGLVIAGNIAMVFVFWELVGICSYFLIGFYRERRSASNAANKAFIVNRVGDFGMIVGLMVIWTGMGTFSFGNYTAEDSQPRPGIFTQVRPTAADCRKFGFSATGEDAKLRAPDGLVRLAARDQIAEIYRTEPSAADAELQIRKRLPGWRDEGLGYGLLVVAGLGIFCGCVGKSAQFPLHVWLPDAMEGPTPVSALIHAATMVAAGVYLVGRFYCVFTPEVLLVIALVGCVTLFLAATIALVATDIKRVLAYSTVSQLGYMMFALGVGGWVAGLFHLFTHAFFKSLLFLCSGSVIHATGTNEMPKMGGLRKKMPWTAYTMLVGCLAIAGAGVPFLIGLSGYYSKDAIIAQALVFSRTSPQYAWLFYVAVGGAALTAFYMFRLWFLTFTGQPRDHHVDEHAHESPPVMYVPLVILAILAAVAGGRMVLPNGVWELPEFLLQAEPAGVAVGAANGLLLPGLKMPAQHLAHDPVAHYWATAFAFSAALAGFLVAVGFYGLRWWNPQTLQRAFAPVYRFLWNKWWFDELYQFLFVRPVLGIARLVAAFDQQGIDWMADHLALAARGISTIDDWIDRTFVDGLVNLTARWTYGAALRLRSVETGRLRQYVMFVAVGTVALFVVVTFVWSYALGAK